jgi:hypothetical protein
MRQTISSEVTSTSPSGSTATRANPSKSALVARSPSAIA